MFVLGLLVGPAIGLALGFLLPRAGGGVPWLGPIVVGLVVIFLLFAGFVPLELKIGLLAGLVLGFLLDGTAYLAGNTEQSGHDPSGTQA
ncbi:MAG: hypothetical protein ACRDFS_10360 [Chloroflexota bacterium]